MKHDTHVSVVMCTCNGERYLEEQLLSSSGQTLQPMELVVCDDGSADRTLSLLRQFATSARFPVLIHCNERQLGSTGNFQQAIELAVGDLIALCDQDDLWPPKRLKHLTKVFENNGIEGVCTDSSLIDDLGRRLARSLRSRGHLSTAGKQQFVEDPVGLLLKQDVATGATMMFRRGVRDLSDEIPREWVHDGWLTRMMTFQVTMLVPSHLRYGRGVWTAVRDVNE